jgi:hypothetical protein
VNASLEEFEHEVLTHPVFLVQAAMKEGALCERLTIPFLQLVFFIRLSNSVKKLPGKAVKARPTPGSRVNALVAEGLEGMAVGDELFVITWLHQAGRDILQVHPRGDETVPLADQTVFRSFCR